MISILVPPRSMPSRKSVMSFGLLSYARTGATPITRQPPVLHNAASSRESGQMIKSIDNSNWRQSWANTCWRGYWAFRIRSRHHLHVRALDATHTRLALRRVIVHFAARRSPSRRACVLKPHANRRARRHSGRTQRSLCRKMAHVHSVGRRSTLGMTPRFGAVIESEPLRANISNEQEDATAPRR
jgi:hypothetical protein